MKRDQSELKRRKTVFDEVGLAEWCLLLAGKDGLLSVEVGTCRIPDVSFFFSINKVRRVHTCRAHVRVEGWDGRSIPIAAIPLIRGRTLRIHRRKCHVDIGHRRLGASLPPPNSLLRPGAILITARFVISLVLGDFVKTLSSLYYPWKAFFFIGPSYFLHYRSFCFFLRPRCTFEGGCQGGGFVVKSWVGPCMIPLGGSGGYASGFVIWMHFKSIKEEAFMASPH